MADGLLNKASIILTPTGYKAGTLYNVAPIDEPYEDFDFSRASVASRVNSSGLVEMVGRTLGSDLNDLTWNAFGGWSILDGVATNDGSGSTILNEILEIGKTYKITIQLSTYTSGNFSVFLGSGTESSQFNGTDEFIFYGVCSGDAYVRVKSYSGIGSVNLQNISVKEIIDTNNIPRISYDSNGDNGHILLEPTSTNLITYSEDFTEWTSKTNIEVNLNNTTSPQGVINAAFINEDNDNAQHFVGQSISITSGQDICISVYAKKNQRDVLQISPSANYLTTSGYANYDLTNGLVTASGGGVTAEIEVVSNNWYRCIAKFTANNTASGTTAFFLQNSTTASRGDSYDGDGSSGLYLWGAQVEALSYATSYIPTLTGSQEVRATETATGAGSADLINSTEGVLYAEIAALANDGTSRRISLSNGSISNRVSLEIDETANRIRVHINASLITYDASDLTSFNKIAVKYKVNDYALWLNGVEVATSSSSEQPSGMNVLSFTNPTEAQVFYGKVKALAVFNEALSDSELTQLTT